MILSTSLSVSASRWPVCVYITMTVILVVLGAVVSCSRAAPVVTCPVATLVVRR